LPCTNLTTNQNPENTRRFPTTRPSGSQQRGADRQDSDGCLFFFFGWSGFSGGFSIEKSGDALDKIVAHEWFSDLDVNAIMAGEGETPKIPPKIPMGELLGQKVDELPWSMGSTFLSKQKLSAEEQEAFADW